LFLAFPDVKRPAICTRLASSDEFGYGLGLDAGTTAKVTGQAERKMAFTGIGSAHASAQTLR
jgi:hypothetical protein